MRNTHILHRPNTRRKPRCKSRRIRDATRVLLGDAPPAQPKRLIVIAVRGVMRSTRSPPERSWPCAARASDVQISGASLPSGYAEPFGVARASRGSRCRRTRPRPARPSPNSIAAVLKPCRPLPYSRRLRPCSLEADRLKSRVSSVRCDLRVAKCIAVYRLQCSGVRRFKTPREFGPSGGSPTRCHIAAAVKSPGSASANPKPWLSITHGRS